MILHPTYGVKYLGSKKKLLSLLSETAKEFKVKTLLDVFTGTTRVAQYLRQEGIRCITSDLNWASRCYANTFVHNPNTRHLQEHVDRMMELPPKEGWLTKNYSGNVPVETKRGEGRCWQPKNAMRADAARDYVQTLKLSQKEKDVLITSIIFALDKVDNTVGVQQAYLKEWCVRSYKDIVFELPPLITGPTGEHVTGDALRLPYPNADMAYLDPPYSPHSYSTYYHIWDSIVKWDKPPTDLTARRRVDRVARHAKYDKSMESEWNIRGRAIEAFRNLIKRLPVRWVMISYNNESIIDAAELCLVCSTFDVTRNPVIKTAVNRRNIMSQIGNAARNVEDPEDTPEKAQKNNEIVIIIDKGKQ